MLRKSGRAECRAGRQDFVAIFIKPSINKITTNIGKIDYKSHIYILKKKFNEKKFHLDL